VSCLTTAVSELGTNKIKSMRVVDDLSLRPIMEDASDTSCVMVNVMRTSIVQPTGFNHKLSSRCCRSARSIAWDLSITGEDNCAKISSIILEVLRISS